ncbi:MULTISPECIES: DNA cytosine methyltransferase [Saccharothrix]|uniref:DNA cytosine methyltransferase n=1 Tax=Saccharothrix TaxID=2071 RepID=UPI00093EBB7E|nr:DNA cytosine methyltransferase [Saccharothrix sp. CB00851]OKI33442.1 cytosine methyltransferase [Saccharothrix sp. CB00851]
MISDAVQLSLSIDDPSEVGTSIELFTGGGGLAMAMHNEGFRHLVAVELNKRACATLRANIAEPFDPEAGQATTLHSRWPLIEGDIRQVDFTRWMGKVDVVAGGVPCQPWSLGGVHKGYDDERNLWPELFRVIRETRPRAIIAENVKGLLRSSFKPYYDYILNELSAPFEERIEGEDWQDHDKRLRKALAKQAVDPTERYDVKYLLVNAADYGVPQVRWRVFVVAFRNDLGLEGWKFPAATHSDAALLRAQADGSYWDEHKVAKRYRYTPKIVAAQGEENEGKQRWRTVRDAISGDSSRNEPRLGEPLGDKVEHPKHLHHYGWPGARQYPGHTPNELDRPAKTVKAGVHGVPGGETVLRRDDGSIRYMTVREVSRVMTFPDDWKLDGPRGEQMRQLGNAVPVVLGQAMAHSVVKALRSSSQSGS